MKLFEKPSNRDYRWWQHVWLCGEIWENWMRIIWRGFLIVKFATWEDSFEHHLSNLFHISPMYERNETLHALKRDVKEMWRYDETWASEKSWKRSTMTRSEVFNLKNLIKMGQNLLIFSNFHFDDEISHDWRGWRFSEDPVSLSPSIFVFMRNKILSDLQ